MMENMGKVLVVYFSIRLHVEAMRRPCFNVRIKVGDHIPANIQRTHPLHASYMYQTYQAQNRIVPHLAKVD